MMLDPFKLAQMDKSKVLRIRESRSETTCVLCDGPISPYDWIVTIPDTKSAKAHTHCAADHGWRVR